jgi:adenylyl- and sulfurtransferase ThiI
MLYLAKLGELTLKGSNKKDFERRLVENARLALEKRTRQNIFLMI